MEIWNLYNQLYNSALKEWRGECGGGGGGGGELRHGQSVSLRLNINDSRKRDNKYT